MPDLFDTQENNPRHVYKVSEITQDIKLLLENTFSGVWVEGEVSNFKTASSGHFYFSLKEERDGQSSLLAAAMFNRSNSKLKFKLEDGMQVICFGKVDVYAPRGQYQLIVERIEPKGLGAQQLALEQLKKKLAKEGFFDPSRKRELPLMPFCVGVVTSASGAALRDILEILKKGAPCVDVVVRSVLVQGDSAPGQISRAIEELNEFNKVEAIIVSRGGGSKEDLWAFNDEAVARAIYCSRIPVISAVGHQIDVSIADMVADMFVETPSAAAKTIADKRQALLSQIDGFRYELGMEVSELIGGLRNTLTALQHMLKSPVDELRERQQMLDEIRYDLDRNIGQYLNIKNERAFALVGRLEALSPLAVLGRGYSLTMKLPSGSIIKSVSEIKAGDLVKARLHNGSFTARVQEVSEDERKTIF